jgi:hypothetical protein
MNPDEQLALLRHVMFLQAKLDALTLAVELLAKNNGSTSQQFRDGLQTLTQTILQKRLERIEGQAPQWAALIATGIDLPKVDQSLLDKLKIQPE